MRYAAIPDVTRFHTALLKIASSTCGLQCRTICEPLTLVSLFQSSKNSLYYTERGSSLWYQRNADLSDMAKWPESWRAGWGIKGEVESFNRVACQPLTLLHAQTSLRSVEPSSCLVAFCVQ